ncbi:MAG: signal peptidase II [Gammaproteobacteria bacterium]|nr:signal peptidase II [Gammaproteobacteria bacterium]MDH5730561.1 signal peptidase II [Gammaproteobacteria bacterium]
MRLIKRISLVFAIIFACAGCDQITKQVASSSLEFNQIYSFAGDLFRLHYVFNKGAFLGLGDTLSEQQRHIIFIVLVSIVLLAVLIYTIANHAMNLSDAVAYSIILGGGFSNLFDRVTNNGVVIDFLNIGVAQVRTGIFNLADVFIMVGVLLFLFNTQIFHSKKT